MEFVRERAKKFSDLKSRNYTEFLRGKPILNGPLERLANFSSFFFGGGGGCHCNDFLRGEDVFNRFIKGEIERLKMQ